LRTEPFQHNECRGFFAGILPEANKRQIIAANLGISPRNDFAMLEQIGGECAGAVSLLPTDQQPPQDSLYKYRKLTDNQLAHILQSLPNRPLMAGAEDIRLSLAGAQDKLAVHIANGSISLPLNLAPSTHIIKPIIAQFTDLVFNESFCMQLAAAVEIPVATVSIHQVQNIDYLLVKRYDRIYDQSNAIKRLHQEDFCQALGIHPDNKYQREGGPSFSQCFNLLRAVSTQPVTDLQQLLNALIFNLLIGNNDAHGKNFSLLYQDNSTRLAPLYDLLSTTYYPQLSNKMAMKIGGKYLADKLFPRHFTKLANDIAFSEALVRKRVMELTDTVLAELTKMTISHPVTEKLARLIMQNCQTLLQRFTSDKS
jgi:serine/threonine-protein kinase HipA